MSAAGAAAGRSAAAETPGRLQPGAAWHALGVAEAVARLETSLERGLEPGEAARRLAVGGPNALPETPRAGIAAVFLRQFASPLIYLLFVAAALSIAVGERTDASVIVAVLLVNAVVGAFQEGRAQRSMDALRHLAALRVRVIRGGVEGIVASADVVPGDLLLLAAGDAVAADARLVEAAHLRVAQAALTGESVPVGKRSAPVPEDADLPERASMVHAGTHVAAGRGRAVVVATGARTEVGRLAELTRAAPAPETPLERRVARLGRTLALAALGLFGVVLGAGLARGLPRAEILMVAVSQLVSVVPEGLPVAMTVALAVGMQRMAARRAVVRRLAAVESLGSTTVICTDKTGTLTRNEMTVTAVVLPGGRELAVTGTGYAPLGEVVEGGRGVRAGGDPGLRALLQAAVLCNDARLASPDEADPRWRALGDPTEAALLTVAGKAGLDAEAARRRRPRTGELPFDAEVRMMATEHAGDRPRVFVKGAPEAVLPLCAAERRGAGGAPLDAGARRAWLDGSQRLASGALRVLAVASGEDVRLGPRGYAALEGRLTLLGLVGQLDPPRDEAHDAVAECRRAGIRPVMVTGDQKPTALAVARAVGVAREGDVALDGRELERLGGEELERELDRVAVFARVQPSQKLRIVEALQARREVVAMTGDGVNDAPALVRADVGVAMGLTGTEVAKEASDIVLADDHFATLVDAVAEGRLVYRNLQKILLLLLSTGAAEIVVLLGTLLLGMPLPFAAVQILWNNVVTEGTITVNLAMEPREGDEMRRPPIARDDPLLTAAMLQRVVAMSCTIAAVTIAWFAVRLHQGAPLVHARTGAFTLLAVCEWFNVLNCRSETRSALRGALHRNRWLLAGLAVSNLLQLAVVYWAPLGGVFRTVPLPLGEVLAIGAVGSAVLWVEEARKALARRRAARGAKAYG